MMKMMYEGENNSMNFVFIEDTDNDRSIIVDWDLDEDEIGNYISKFEAGELSEADCYRAWQEGEETARDGLWNIHHLASSELKESV